MGSKSGDSPLIVRMKEFKTSIRGTTIFRELTMTEENPYPSDDENDKANEITRLIEPRNLTQNYSSNDVMQQDELTMTKLTYKQEFHGDSFIEQEIDESSEQQNEGPFNALMNNYITPSMS